MRERLAVLFARIAGDNHCRRLFDVGLLYFGPGLGIGSPGMRGGLLRRQRRRHKSHQCGVELANLHLVALRPNPDGMRMFAEDHFDTPDGGGGVVIAPCKLRWDEVGRIDRAVCRRIDCDCRLCGRIHWNWGEVRRNRGGTRLGWGYRRRGAFLIGSLVYSLSCHTCSSGEQDSRCHHKHPFHAISSLATPNFGSRTVPRTCLEGHVRKSPRTQITHIDSSKIVKWFAPKL